MTSNCYVVYDDVTKACIVIDPGSEKSEREILFIEENCLHLDYIILTHEHTDHTWGCNSLLVKFNPKVICSKACSQELPKAGDVYFQLYYDNLKYHYEVARVDVLIEDINYKLNWNGSVINFIPTPGHSKGAICFDVDNYLFSGDTIMKYKPYVKRGSIEEYKASVKCIEETYSNKNMILCPGHGEMIEYKNSQE